VKPCVEVLSRPRGKHVSSCNEDWIGTANLWRMTRPKGPSHGHNSDVTGQKAPRFTLFSSSIPTPTTLHSSFVRIVCRI
jgi:hypothetical protein